MNVRTDLSPNLLPKPDFDTCSFLDETNSSISIRSELSPGNSNQKLINVIEQSNLVKLSLSLAKSLDLSQPTAGETAKRIIELQKNLVTDAEAIEIEETEELPKLVITKERIHCLIKRVGQGSYAQVFKVEIFPTTQHTLGDKSLSPSKTAMMALKQSNKPGGTFSPERTISNWIRNKNGMDLSLATFKIPDGPGYSVNELYDTCLSDAKFEQMQAPVLAILQVLIQVANGLKNLHDTDLIHRDVKGANILVKVEGGNPADLSPDLYPEKIIGVLTDFGLCRTEPIISQRDMKTLGTPFYLDPSMFGEPKMSLFKQKIRSGVQTKEGDIYAFGVTIIYDVLLKFFTEKAKQFDHEKTEIRFEEKGIEESKAEIPENEIVKEISACKVRHKKGTFEYEDLQRIGEKYKFRATYLTNNQEEEVLIIYPKWSKLKKRVENIIKKLSTSLNPIEEDALIQLIGLACGILDSTKRPNVEEVLEKLTLIHSQFQDTFLHKRKRAEIKVADCFLETSELLNQQITQRITEEEDNQSCIPPKKRKPNKS